MGPLAALPAPGRRHRDRRNDLRHQPGGGPGPHLLPDSCGLLGSTGSTRHEMVAMLRMLATTGLRPRIDRVLPLERIHEGFAAMMAGETTGKIVITIA